MSRRCYTLTRLLFFGKVGIIISCIMYNVIRSRCNYFAVLTVQRQLVLGTIVFTRYVTVGHVPNFLHHTGRGRMSNPRCSFDCGAEPEAGDFLTQELNMAFRSIRK
jgi:hypothetical protein